LDVQDHRNTQACLVGHAGVCHDGNDPPSGKPANTQKNDAPVQPDAPSLIHWSIQEIRRVAVRLAQRRLHPAYIIAWSTWRRAHQAIAQRSHMKQKLQL
jgi:hypothetical protein